MENTVPGYPHSVAIYSTFFSKYWYRGDDNAMHTGTSTGNWEGGLLHSCCGERGLAAELDALVRFVVISASHAHFHANEKLHNLNFRGRIL